MTGPDAPRRPSVGLVIVTYNAPTGMLERAVESLVDSLSDLDPASWSIVVVDNGGLAAGRLAAAELDAPLEMIVPDENRGFGAAVNVGFDRLLARGADAVACLNDDLVFTSGWLTPLLDELARDPRVGGVQPLLVHGPDRPDVINSGGLTIDRFGAGSDHLRDVPASTVNDALDVAGVTGGAAIFSAAFVRDVGPFDERFFLYYEDVELCRRGARRGWRFRSVPASRVTHHGSASTVQLGDNVRFLQERNRLWSSAMSGSPRELLEGLGLSIRRLRYEPRDIHRRALLAAVPGVASRLARRAFTAVRRGSRSAPPQGRGGRSPIGRPLDGVNVVGYHHISSGLGDAAREFVECLRAAGVAVVEIDNDLSDSPRRRAARPMPDTVFDTTIAFVTAFEFPYFRHRFPQLGGPGHRMIGYWYWELSTVPEQHVDALGCADEIWTPTRFVRDAYAGAAAGRVPVRLAPPRLPEPRAAQDRVDRWRTEFGPAFTFLVSFDYLSIPERKNPQAAIAAFRQTFPLPDDAHRMVVKSINRDRRPQHAALVESAADGDGRIVFLDDHLDDDDLFALIAAADCLVSPHRSEGLGLHPAAAMALGTPVIATRYGGVVDFCTDENAVLVDFDVVGVVDGEGIYPVDAPWASIDVDALATAMRSVADDPTRRERLVTAGLATIRGQGSRAEFGERYRQMLVSLGRLTDG